MINFDFRQQRWTPWLVQICGGSVIDMITSRPTGAFQKPNFVFFHAMVDDKNSRHQRMDPLTANLMGGSDFRNKNVQIAIVFSNLIWVFIMILQHLIDNVQRIAHAKFGQNPIEIDWEMAILVKKVTFLEFSAHFLGTKNERKYLIFWHYVHMQKLNHTPSKYQVGLRTLNTENSFFGKIS